MPSSVQGEPAGSAPVVLLVLDAGAVVGAGSGVVVVDVASGVGETRMVTEVVLVLVGTEAFLAMRFGHYFKSSS